MTWPEGAQLGPRVVASVSADHMRALAVVLDDPNPIHLDPQATRALGLGDRVINQGPANVAYVIDMLHEAIPGGFVEDLQVRLLGNVFAQDRLVAAGRVTAVEADGSRLLCRVWLDVDGGRRAVEGTAAVRLPR